MKHLLLADPNIVSVASGNSTPGGNDFSMQGKQIETNEGEKVEKMYSVYGIDQDYLRTLEIPLLLGR